MEEIASVYARSLFEVAQAHGKLDTIHEQLAQFADALEQSRELQIFFFSPYFSSEEKREGIGRVVVDGDEHLVRFLELLAEKHRLPFVARINRALHELWAEEQRLLDVEVTSAIQLDAATVEAIGRRIEQQTGRRIQLSAKVDEGVIGGLVLKVGNMVLDASIRNRLERLRKQVAAAA
ncbi:MAG: ATP synthase F1 subunit delta [Thermoleophilaceae bacterium]|nr:ATP synthase F1 subunit delta [Thermoleophilaceae bacterium]